VRLAPSRFLVLRCRSWPAVALGRDRDATLAVVEKGRILAATPAAIAAGVSIGQPRREAAWNCPLLEFVLREEGEERRAFAPALRALEAFGAAITVRRPGWAWIETRGPARYFGGEDLLALAVAEALRSLGGEWEGGVGLLGGCFGIGVGDGVFVATRAAARGVVVPHDETVAFLEPIPVEQLGDPTLSQVLRNLGIMTLGSFAKLEGSDVLARFGWDGYRAHQIARSEESVGSVAVHRRDVDAEIMTEIEPPAELVDQVVLVARGLAEELCTRIRAEGLAFSLLRVSVETEERDVSSRRWSHDGPFTSALVIERVRWQLEGWMAPQRADETSHLVGGVVVLRLGAEEIVPDGGRQEGLWERGSAGEHHVVQAFARVQGIVGPEGVLLGSLVGGRGPSDRIELHPFGDTVVHAVRPVNHPWPGQIPPPSPILVFEPASEIAVFDGTGSPLRVDGRGELSGEPALVALGAASRPITAWAGPWLLDERWWDRTRHRRRARFQLVADEDVYLVALDGGRFFLEGVYD
jgi:protein ImuB